MGNTQRIQGVAGDSEVAVAKSQIALFGPAIELFWLTFDRHPTSLSELVVAPADVDEDKWERIIAPLFGGGRMPLDPWEGEYRFVAPGKHNPDNYDLWSFGPDRTDGTADDIGNWAEPN